MYIIKALWPTNICHWTRWQARSGSVRFGVQCECFHFISRFVLQAESVRFGSVRVGLQCEWRLMRPANPCTTRQVFNTYLTENATRREWYDENDASILTTRATRPDATRATRSGPSGVGCQDGWRGLNRTYVKLRTTLAVNLNLNMSCGIRKRTFLYRWRDLLPYRPFATRHR